MVRLKLTLAYDGGNFKGWQLQREDSTIQGTLEAAVARILGHTARVQGAGRTDTGVHALGQVAHLDIPEHKLSVPWQRALNCPLPESISVLAVEQVPREFHARFGARSKTYAYTLWTTRAFVFPQRRRYVWDCGPLDLPAMDAAAPHFLGRHDFKSFMNAGTPVKSTVRTVTRLERCAGLCGHEVVWRVEADGFLKQMVRNMVGLLVEVGRGKAAPESVRTILEAGDRTRAAATAPARGLCLERVEYGDGCERVHQDHVES